MLTTPFPPLARLSTSAGEDPFLSGQYAANFIQGFEHADEDPYSIVQSSTCCKHFVANELESWGGQTRHTIDVAVPEQDLVDSYLPSFQTCVEEGKATGIMCSCEYHVNRYFYFPLTVTFDCDNIFTPPPPSLPSQTMLSTAYRRALQNGCLRLCFVKHGILMVT